MTAARGGTTPKLVVERDGTKVTLTVECSSQYDAIELYEQVCADAREGFVELYLETTT